MILRSLGHGFYLIFRKPAAKCPILPDNPAGHQVVLLPPFAQARVVVGRDGVHHIYINVIDGPLVIAGLTGNPCQLQTFFYHRPRMIHAMRLIETRIAGDDL